MFQNVPLFPESASTNSGQIDLIYLFLVVVSIVSMVLVSGALLTFMVMYRKRKDGPAPVQIHGSTQLEIAWTLLPLVIVLVMFGWGAALYVKVLTPPPNVMDVYVVGKQWMWKVQHPKGQREINDLHIPVGQPVRFTMTSEDVIHAYYIPAMRIKRDVVPGRYSQMWFEATKVGTYHLFCAEYCGTEHSRMIGQVHVMEPKDYEAWLASSLINERPEDVGKVLFEANRCDTCHAAGADQRGPSLAGVYGKEVQLAGGSKAIVNDDYVRESILRPHTKVVAGYQPVMPSYDGQLSEEQVIQIITYIKSLKAQGGAN